MWLWLDLDLDLDWLQFPLLVLSSRNNGQSGPTLSANICVFFNVEIHAGAKILDAKVKEFIAKASISRQPSAVRQKLKEMRTKYRKLPQ